MSLSEQVFQELLSGGAGNTPEARLQALTAIRLLRMDVQHIRKNAQYPALKASAVDSVKSLVYYITHGIMVIARTCCI